MTRQAEVSRVMRDVRQRVDDVQNVVVATRDGLPLGATASDTTAEKVAAMAASVLALALQAIDGVEGDGDQTVIRGTEGCLVVQGAGPDALIAVHTGANPNMGLVQVEVPRAAADLEKALG